jgi:HD-GYP domain-containing protein (c-di-GMP phosphodiesterase class II)
MSMFLEFNLTFTWAITPLELTFAIHRNFNPNLPGLFPQIFPDLSPNLYAMPRFFYASSVEVRDAEVPRGYFVLNFTLEAGETFQCFGGAGLRAGEKKMKISFISMLYAFSSGLDFVEHDMLGVSTHHSKRVAYIASQLGSFFGLDDNQRSDLAGCALLHDNALTEYIQEEADRGNNVLRNQDRDMSRHCTIGEKHIKSIPFFGDVGKVVLYHHENVGGTGPFGKKAGEIPLYSALIHLGDQLDSTFHFNTMTDEKYRQLVDFVRQKAGRFFFPEHAEAFLDLFTRRKFFDLTDKELDGAIARSVPMFRTEYRPDQVFAFSSVFARIIDYKSRFTREHSMGLAEKAAAIADYYHFDLEKKASFYLAATLHDIGKLAVDINILEKPGRLTSAEFSAIQEHAWHSYRLLHDVDGFQKMNSWASYHHEKLDGSGYPFGLTEIDLGFEERLMACLDIYQALVEKRPYKEGMPHNKAIAILDKMAKRGAIDGNIVSDLNDKFGETYSELTEAALVGDYGRQFN